MTTSHERTVVIRYRPGSTDGWPWELTHDDGQTVLTINDLDDSAIGIVLRALAQAGDEPATAAGPTAHEAHLATT